MQQNIGLKLTGHPVKCSLISTHPSIIQNPPPKKKKKLKPIPITDPDAEDSGAGGSGAATEVEIVFKLHPKMSEHKELVAPIKEMSTRWVDKMVML